ncbi:MAG: hypothetical protein KY476_05730 [Planctomycetes bacterium]|nr:hypothetical protein [Planctomycetota bacterium]
MSDLMVLAQIGVTWYLLPLAAVISLVYSASRYELPEMILRRATRLFFTIMIFMSVVFGILLALSFRL